MKRRFNYGPGYPGRTKRFDNREHYDSSNMNHQMELQFNRSSSGYQGSRPVYSDRSQLYEGVLNNQQRSHNYGRDREYLFGRNNRQNIPLDQNYAQNNHYDKKNAGPNSDHGRSGEEALAKSLSHHETIFPDASDNTLKITISNKDEGSSRQVENCEDIIQCGCSEMQNSYLISKGRCKDLVPKLQSNPPQFVKDLNNFMHANKTHKSINIFCANCNCGPTNDWNKICEHIKGKNHSKKVPSSIEFIKILMCLKCSKIKLHFNSEDDSCVHKELPDDSSFIFNKIFPNATQRYAPSKVVEKQDLKDKKETIREKLARPIDFIFYEIPQDYDMISLFSDLINYSKQNDLVLHYVYFGSHSRGKTAFCRFTQSNPKNTNQPQNKFNCYSNIFIAGTKVRTDVVPSFDKPLQIFKSKHSMSSCEWWYGELSPLCKQLNRLFSLVDRKLIEMDETSFHYDELTRRISHDLYRVTSGAYKVTSIDYFGSRVTGLAFADSDFDLQISISPLRREAVTVRALTRRCLGNSQLFTVKDVIPWAKVPIIKVQHDQTLSMCDISLNNMNGVVNSQLLKFYLAFDRRVKWLVVAVKVWATMNFIIGSFSFTSYTLAWLVLFFLMQDDISLIPVVSSLTEICCSNQQFLLHCSETSMKFSLDMNEVKKVHDPQLKCKMSTAQLFYRFFQFFLNLCTSKERNYAYDTFTGKIVPRNQLLDILKDYPIKGNLNLGQNIYSYTLLVVDPIKHCYNISAAVNTKLLITTSQLCEQTLECCSQVSTL